jgi:hypothetical protein
MTLPTESCVMIFLDVRESYCTKHRHLYITWSLPHTVYLAYEECMLVPHSPLPELYDTTLFYTRVIRCDIMLY